MAAPNFRLPVHPPNADWGEWIHLAANGDQTALARLYDGTSRVVFGLILRILQDRAIAEDVLLDVYLHVWRKGATYSMNKGTPLGWLLTIARSRAIDALRSRTTRASLQQDPLETTDVIADPSPDPKIRGWNPLGFKIVDFTPEPEVLTDAAPAVAAATAKP